MMVSIQGENSIFIKFVVDLSKIVQSNCQSGHETELCMSKQGVRSGWFSCLVWGYVRNSASKQLAQLADAISGQFITCVYDMFCQ